MVHCCSGNISECSSSSNSSFSSKSVDLANKLKNTISIRKMAMMDIDELEDSSCSSFGKRNYNSEI